MTTRLIQHAFTRVNQDHRQITSRCACRHITGVLLMPRCIGNDEFALLG
ncbi:Uncharacterised protein [Vibrio cholerae]|nr:Uncharacterised protein [Vibrio cholerae]